MNSKAHSIKVVPVQLQETEALLALYIDLFHDREPLTRCGGLTRERMAEIARSSYLVGETSPLEKKLCWLAKDTDQNDRNIGFIVCDDPALEKEDDLLQSLTEQERENLSVLMSYMQALRAPVQDKLVPPSGRVIHIAAVGVAPGYEGAGIATQLIEAAVEGARVQGYEFIFAECTGQASRRCHEKLGFQSLHCINLSEFECEGRQPFQDQDIDVCLLWKSLTASL